MGQCTVGIGQLRQIGKFVWSGDEIRIVLRAVTLGKGLSYGAVPEQRSIGIAIETGRCSDAEGWHYERPDVFCYRSKSERQTSRVVDNFQSSVGKEHKASGLQLQIHRLTSLHAACVFPGRCVIVTGMECQGAATAVGQFADAETIAS